MSTEGGCSSLLSSLLMLLALFDSDLERSTPPNFHDLLKRPSSTTFQVIFGPRPTPPGYTDQQASLSKCQIFLIRGDTGQGPQRSRVADSRTQESGIGNRNLPTIPQPLVLGILSGSVSHTHPHCSPTQPSHMRNDLYRL